MIFRCITQVDKEGTVSLSLSLSHTSLRKEAQPDDSNICQQGIFSIVFQATLTLHSVPLSKSSRDRGIEEEEVAKFRKMQRSLKLSLLEIFLLSFYYVSLEVKNRNLGQLSRPITKEQKLLILSSWLFTQFVHLHR